MVGTIISALAWPVCGVVVVLGALYMFKRDIGGFISRLKSITTPRGSVDTTALAPQEPPPPAPTSAADELLRSFDNQLLLEQENMILASLQEGHIQVPAERERVLVRLLASAHITARFESAYHLIFGSQLSALEVLNQSEPQGLTEPALQAFYDLAKAVQPQFYTTYTFADWLGYLTAWLLVTPSVNGFLHITLFGKEFLKYIVQCGYSSNKNG